MAGRIKNRIRELRSGATPLKWAPLDNAAKIFPPTSHGADSGVFRLSCELTEQVDPALLQQGLDEALTQFGHMRMVLRHGLFWFYLEQTTIRPVVVPEHDAPCAPLYRDARSLLFEVSYWHNKVNLEVFHVLTDGSGAFAFFRAILTRYLSLRHPEHGAPIPADASVFDRREDSFQRYYKKQRATSPVSARRAYTLKGAKRAEGGLSFLVGVADVGKVLDAAHRYQATMTVYLCSVLLWAIHAEMYVRDMARPVVLTVPVDLRGFFPSDTARNFFGTFQVSVNFQEIGARFEDIVESVKNSFREKLTPEQLGARMNQLAALEHAPGIRVIPLVLKNPVMRFAGYLSDRGETAVLSNVGRFSLPEPLDQYLRGLGVLMSTHALQMCACTCAGKIQFGFSSVYAAPGVQRNFFTRLVADGVDIEVRSNEHHMEDEATCNTARSAK